MRATDIQMHPRKNILYIYIYKINIFLPYPNLLLISILSNTELWVAK